MTRGIFGWSYPPGAASDPYAPYNERDEICKVCGNGVNGCICPECPVCSENGNPDCYDIQSGHGLTKSLDQQIGSAKRAIVELKDQIADHERYISWAEDQKLVEQGLNSVDPKKEEI